MFRKYLFIGSLFTVLHDTPGDGGGAGGADLTGGGGDSTSSDGSSGTSEHDDTGAGDEPAQPARSAATDDELDALLAEEDDPDAEAQLPVDQRFKSLSGRKNKLRRQLQRFKPIIDRFRSVKDPGEIDDMVSQARAYTELQRLIVDDPQRAAAVLGLNVSAPRAAAGQKDEPEGHKDAIDLTKLPFDPHGGEVNAYLLKMGETINALHRELAETRQLTHSMRDRNQGEAQRALATTWKSAIDAAVSKLPDEGTRILFKDAMTGAYSRYAGKVPPQRIVDHYLGQFVTSKQTQKLASDAARQRIAQNNGARTTGNVTGGTPAHVNGNKRQTWDDARKQFAQRIAGS